ncbi:hypothetical protein, partial [Burkholderia sp. Bp8998]|uniref:hypothetical protein n=1 Tax=Burkholderia sp. Bp8998 TaxID=2184557 RepID=UPI001C8A121B
MVHPLAACHYDTRPFVADGIFDGRRQEAALLQAAKRVVRIGVEGIQGSGGLKNQVQRLANPAAANSIAIASSGV